MKGCLAVVGVLALLLVIFFAGCTGFLFYKGKQVSDEREAAIERLRGTNESHPFSPPEDGLLDAERLDTYLEIRSAASAPLDEMFAKAGELERMDEENVGFIEGVSRAVGAVTGMASAFLEAPAALATSLAEHRMSYDEYDWTTGVIHGTIRRAAEDGEEPAVALSDAISKSLGRIDARVNDQEFDEGSLRELESRIDEWKPENLALISERSQAIAAGAPMLMLDVLAVGMASEVSGRPPAGSAEDATDSGDGD